MSILLFTLREGADKAFGKLPEGSVTQISLTADYLRRLCRQPTCFWHWGQPL